MARIRTIKPEFFRSRVLSECSLRARLTFIGLWTVCDDEGRYRYEPELLKADLWPFEEEVTAKEVNTDVLELEGRGLVCCYETAGKRFIHVVNWHEHQKINRPTPSRLPECSREAHGTLSESSTLEVEVEVEVEVEKERDQGVRPTADATPDTVTVIPTAQTFLAAYIDAYRGRAGHDPPRQVKGQVARHLRTAFEDGIPADTIKAGFVDWFDRDQHPATLPSFIEVAGRGGRPRTRPTRAQQQRAQLLETDRALRQWAEGGDSDGQDRVDRDRGPAQRKLSRPGTPS